MSSPTLMNNTPPQVVVGVDTHADTHTACILNTSDGARLGTKTFRADGPGYRALLQWAGSHGEVSRMGIEQTSSYGAALTRAARRAGIYDLVEINQPAVLVRATKGKTDAIDAETAARHVLAGTATAIAKDTDGIIEAIRLIKTQRALAVKHRAATITQLRSLLITIDDDLRHQLRDLPTTALIDTCTRLRPDPTQLATPLHAGKQVLRQVAKRIQSLTTEIDQAEQQLDALTLRVVPSLRAEPQIGPIGAAELVTAFGGPGRIVSHAAFARITGIAPIPASSGKTDRHRLHRGGNRQANKTIHMIVIGRMKTDPKTRTYIDDRTPQSKNPNNKRNKKPAIRSLKRHIIRRCWRLINNDLNNGVDRL